MKKIFWILFPSLLISLSSKAQQPGQVLTQWADRSPIEKIYLHLDKDNYLAGETIWFKAYLYSEFLPDTVSTTLYAELLNASSTIISRKILPVFFGNSIGQFELPDSLSTGLYFIRSYSPTMLNQSPDFLYKRSVFIYGKKSRAEGSVKQKDKMTRLEFFPESGNFISGFGNTIAFKAADENGLPASVKGVVKNDRDETVTVFESYHDGMGMLDIAAKPKENYYVVLNNDTSGKKYFLPEQTERGIVFRVMEEPRGKYFELFQDKDDSVFRAAYMIGQMQHHIVFRQEFPQGYDKIKGVIQTSGLSSGIVQITVFNKDNLPLAERLIFIDNKEYIQPAELILDTVDFSERSKNHFSVLLKDTVQGSFSVAVTDPDFDLSATREENIYSRLLLTSDLKGYVHNPAYYFSGNDDSVKNALDLLMMTNGWRRFRWNDLLNGQLPSGNYKDPGYIVLAGKINIEGTRKSFADRSLIIFIEGADSSRSIQMINTDGQGYFREDSLVFFDMAHILFKDIRGRKSDQLEVKMAADSLTKPYFIPAIEKLPFTISDTTVAGKLAYDYNAILKASGLMLKNVTIRVRKKTPVQELEERYASGLFSGFTERTIDLVNTNEVINERNIFEYLKWRVPGLNVTNDGFDYRITYRQGVSLSSMGSPGMALYLDEIETDASFISTIPANQVAMVKVFSSFVGAVGNGQGGALAIYTKKGTDLYSSTSTADKITYRGYSIIKEFYSPDYSVNSKADDKIDHRITLHWMPDILVSDVNAKIPVVFYNNNRTKHFKIVVEGMTNDGKMVCIEKIIDGNLPKKAF